MVSISNIFQPPFFKPLSTGYSTLKSVVMHILFHDLDSLIVFKGAMTIFVGLQALWASFSTIPYSEVWQCLLIKIVGFYRIMYDFEIVIVACTHFYAFDSLTTLGGFRQQNNVSPVCDLQKTLERQTRMVWLIRTCQILPQSISKMTCTEHGMDWSSLSKTLRCTCSQYTISSQFWELASSYFFRRQSCQHYFLFLVLTLFLS